MNRINSFVKFYKDNIDYGIRDSHPISVSERELAMWVGIRDAIRGRRVKE